MTARKLQWIRTDALKEPLWYATGAAHSYNVKRCDANQFELSVIDMAGDHRYLGDFKTLSAAKGCATRLERGEQPDA